MLTLPSYLPSRLMVLADLRYRLYAGEGGSVHIRAMAQAFSEFLEVHEPACPVSLGLLRGNMEGNRPVVARKLAETLALGTGVIEKVAAYARLRPSLIYVRHELSELPTLVLLKLLGARIALEVNGIVAEERSASLSPGRERLTRWLEGLAFRISDQIFCVSGYLQARLVASGVAPEKITVTHNGIAPNDFPAEAVQRQAEVSVLGFNGTNKPWHGLPVLVEAFAAIAGRHPGLRLLIVGPSSLELEAAVQAFGLNDRVEITGYLPHEEALSATRRIDLAVLPNCPPHNSPLKLFEYMGLGKPIIAARTPGIAEVLEDGETSLLIEPNSRDELIEAIERLIADAGLRERLGRAARQAVLERYTWRHNALAVLSRALPGAWGP